MIWLRMFCLKSSQEMPCFCGFLFQILHGIELHVLAHLVELLDQIGIAGDAQIFAFFEKQLLVDQIAQHVFFPLGVDLVGVVRILLLHFVLKLILAARKLRAGNDLIVHAGDDFFDDLSRREARADRCSSNERRGKVFS